MSSSYRNAALGIVALLSAVPALGADYYFTPGVEVSTETHSNRDLVPDGVPTPLDSSVQGYLASLSATTGFRTQRGSTDFRPRLVFQNYPDRDDLAKVNAYLDLRSRYNWQLTNLDVLGRFRREDRTNSQLSSAVIDDFVPDAPVDDTGVRLSFVEEVVTDFLIRPTLNRKLGERTGLALSAGYQDVQFDAEGQAEGVAYQSTDLSADLKWQYSERAELSTGVYGGRYTSAGSENVTNNIGLAVGLANDWSETTRGTLEVQAERTEVNLEGQPTDSSTNMGFAAGIVRTGQVSVMRLSIGRSFTPSSYGSRDRRDELLLQLTRNFSARWALNGAVRVFRSAALGELVDDSDDRTFGRAELNLRWAASRTWYVSGGFTHTRQKYENDPEAADDNAFILRFGYQGLPPQR